MCVKARLAFLNWTAPCGIPAKLKEAQSNLLGTLSAESHHFLGLFLSPAFTHYKGQLWMAEQACYKSLAGQQLSFDKSFLVLLRDRQDARDSRPLNLVGRIVVPAVVDERLESCWKSCALLRTMRTEESDQVKPCDMVVIEDLDVDTLPANCSGTDLSNHRSNSAPRGAKKWEQLGVDTCTKILDSTIDGAAQTGVVAVVDLHMGTGEMMEAFIIKKLSSKIQMRYFGIADTAIQTEGIMKARTETLLARVKSGSLSLPGVQFIPEMPANLLEDAPPLPELQCLIWNVETERLTVPAELTAKWVAHRDFGKCFEQLLEDARSELHYDVALQAATAKTTPSPTKRDKGNDEESPAKRLKTEQFLEPMEKLTADSILKVPLPSVKNTPVFTVLMHDQAVITNESDLPVSIKKGTALMGFGKVTWKRVKEGDDKLLDRELPVAFESSSDLVTMGGGTLQSLHTVVEARRKNTTNITVMYHTMTEDLDSNIAGAFKLQAKQEVPACFDVACAAVAAIAGHCCRCYPAAVIFLLPFLKQQQQELCYLM